LHPTQCVGIDATSTIPLRVCVDLDVRSISEHANELLAINPNSSNTINGDEDNDNGFAMLSSRIITTTTTNNNSNNSN
jgi:hypothetical protein